jgi:hypothetical protein
MLRFQSEGLATYPKVRTLTLPNNGYQKALVFWSGGLASFLLLSSGCLQAPPFMAGVPDGLVWLCTYLSSGGINATIALKLFNSNRQQIELCQKYSMPTCALKISLMDKAVKKNP